MPSHQHGDASHLPIGIQYALVHQARALLDAGLEVFSVEAAACSLALDLVADRAKRPADYCRIWGWSRKVLTARWAEVRALAEAYAGLDPTTSRNTSREHQGTREGQKRVDSDAESHRWEQRGTSRVQLTSTKEKDSSIEESFSASSSTRASSASAPPSARPTARPAKASAPVVEGNPWDPLVAPPTEQQILEAAKRMAGYNEEAAQAFWGYFGPPEETGGTGWIDADGERITNWNLRLRKWMINWTSNRQRDAARAARTGVRDRHAKGADDGGVAELERPWWVWTYEEAERNARKRGEDRTYQHTWPAYRGADGKVYFVAPDNVSRGVPACYTALAIDATNGASRRRA